MNLGVRGAVVFCDEDVSRQNNGGEKAQTPAIALRLREKLTAANKTLDRSASQNDPIRGALLSEEAYGNWARNGRRGGHNQNH